MIGQKISHYEILEKLGEGGMGVVYKAHDTDLDRIVAIKFLPHYLVTDAAEKERFYHEARAASALNHPNITIIHEIKEHDQQLFLVMEYVEGGTLKKLVEHDGPPVKKVIEIAIQIAEGLNAAHEKGVIHRDIKCDNIMITPKGQVKIMDFGLAKVKGATKLTKAGSTIGTAAYMSPEQAQGEEVDHRSDIFSFGVVLYELLACKLPFRGEHQAALMYSLINEEPPPLGRYNEKVSPELERIVLKALSKDPGDRYQHADEMLADLRRERKHLEYARAGYATAASGVQPVLQAAPASAPTPKKKKFFRPLLIAAGVVVVLGLLAIFNPFNYQFVHQNSLAGSDKSTLAVMYFENIPDPDDKDHTGEMLTNLLTTALFQTKELDVVSRERLYDIQKELGQADAKTISPALATKIAGRANVSLMLLGSILQKQPMLTVTYRLVEVQSGKIRSTQRLSGFAGDRLFSLVDTLALLVKDDLHVVPEQTGTGATAPSVASVTTNSVEAYRSYLEGIELNDRFYSAEAAAAFHRAIELDSNFAMAYLRLAVLNLSQMGQSEINALLQKAHALSGNLPERERLQIEAIYSAGILHDMTKAEESLEHLVDKYPSEQSAYLVLCNLYSQDLRFDKSLEILQRGLRNDSLDKNLWNLLAYYSAAVHRKEAALGAIDRYLQIAPAEANPYDSRGDIYALFDDVDSARIFWKKALGFRADFPSNLKLADSYLADGDTATARQYYQAYASSQRNNLKSADALVSCPLLLRTGKVTQCRSYLRTIFPQLRDQSAPNWLKMVLGITALCDYELRDFTSMLADAQALQREANKDTSFKSTNGRGLIIVALEKLGRNAEAQRLMREMKEDRDKQHSMIEKLPYDWAEAVEKSEKGDDAGAADLFTKFFSVVTTLRAPLYHYGVAMLKAGKREEAMTEFRRLVRWADVQNETFDLSGLTFSLYRSFGIAGVKAHYWLGKAYEQAGNTAEALKEYQAFTTIWKDADFKSPELQDARERITKLRETASR